MSCGACGIAAVDSLAETFASARVRTAPILGELYLALPAIAAELQCETTDLFLTDRVFVCLNSPTGHGADRAYKAVGHDIVPFVTHNALHGRCRAQPGLGVIYFKNAETGIRYAVYEQGGAYGDVCFLVVKRGEVFRLARAANRQRQRDANEATAPILAPGILTAVLENTIGFLRHGKEISAFGVRVRQGLLLSGAPGNGKTMLCRYLQKLADKHTYGWDVVTASQIDKAYNDGRLGELFNSYPVTFFDDIDISYLHRERGKGAVACAILSSMDGVVDIALHHMVRVFTTNEDISEMDTAFSRPGRIDGIVKIGPPDKPMREQLVATWHEEILANIDVPDFIQETEEMSFAEIEGIKSLLVTAKVVRGAGWDMQRALNEFRERRDETATFKFHGFAGLTKHARKAAKRAAAQKAANVPVDPAPCAPTQ